MAVVIGTLRHRLLLEQREQTSTSGRLTDNFKVIAEVWGSVEAVRGSAYAAGLQMEERVTHRIVIRHRDPTDFDHLRQGYLHRFKLRDVRDPDGRGRVLEIMAEELTAPGERPANAALDANADYPANGE